MPKGEAKFGRNRPELAEFATRLSKSGAPSSNMRPNSAELGQSWPELGRSWAKVRQIWPELRQTGTGIGQWVDNVRGMSMHGAVGPVARMSLATCARAAVSQQRTGSSASRSKFRLRSACVLSPTRPSPSCAFTRTSHLPSAAPSGPIHHPLITHTFRLP